MQVGAEGGHGRGPVPDGRHLGPLCLQDQLHHPLANLLSNAAKFTSEGTVGVAIGVVDPA
jgi:hypothetical protein